MMGNVTIYAADATKAQCETNGLGTLRATTVKVYEELLVEGQAGIYSATVVIRVSDPLADKMIAGAIVKLSTPKGRELFRVVKTTKTLKEITAECWHISYDLRNGVIDNRAWLDKALSVAWPEIVQAGGDARFSGVSDITDISSLRVVRRSVMETIAGTHDNSVLSRWGGELYRHGWQVDMLQRRGTDRGVQVRYGKNLTGINDEVDVSEMYHEVIPTYLIGADTPKLMTPIKSPLYETTPNPRTVAIHFGDIRVGDGDGEFATEALAEAEVSRRVAKMWVDGADKPRASCTVNFVDLRTTEEYKHLGDLEHIEIGDTVRAVWHGQVDISQRVVSYEWDALRDRYIAITLGSPRRSMVALNNSITSLVGHLVKDASTEAISRYIEMIGSMNETYANALGYYKTIIKNEATGAEQLYIHDKPTLEESSFIATVPEAGTYLWTEGGWNNGNPTWTQGMTKEGNLIIRFIQAVKIAAEWIILESGDDAQTVITQLQAGQLTISDQLAVGGENLLRNPTFGTPHLAEKTGWSTGEIMQLYLERFKGKTMTEMLTTLEGKTINDLINYNY